MRARFTHLAFILVALTGVLIPGEVPAQPPAPATPLPEGALGTQIEWVMSILNGDTASTPESEITAHVDKSVLVQVPAKTLIASIAGLSTQYGPFRSNPVQ